jgi:hypothetical protein
MIIALALVACAYFGFRFRTLKFLYSHRNNEAIQLNSSFENPTPLGLRSKILNAELQRNIDLLVNRVLELYVEYWHNSILCLINVPSRQSTQINTQSFADYMQHVGQQELVFQMNAVRDAYFPIQPRHAINSDFISTVQKDLNESITKIASSLQRIDWGQIIINRIIPILTHHLRFFKQASTALSQSGTRNLTKSEELDLAIASLYKDGDLHCAIVGADRRLLSETTSLEVIYFRPIASRIIDTILISEEKSSSILKPLLVEILSTCVLQPAINMLADPDWWNQTLDIVLTQLISEQRMVNKLRQALEKPFINPSLTPPAENLAIHRPPTFEEYLKHIKVKNQFCIF